VIAYNRHGHRVATVPVSHGRFVVRLAPGYYTIAVAHYPRGFASWEGAVTADTTTHVKIQLTGCK